ncbi:amino acid permease [Campylobacter fetus]|uniref:Amino acid permease n=3 Tax=Campylobacter fetus TaxID=196 RepID=A0A5L8UE72_CAMFE|nr:amino acid permease [Campylobacter fetus]OCS22080.1 gamma-aminobutyrate permease [Campylobacter fetus subsp. venerealis cfvi97/532]OCS26423.1 gamma-aminobutyrate permease [Campylobacter fetus subsp. venerealis cfvB10]OCS29820.1 gamma-aminobutyrate permease [Campylobacter fetus subsp. venerealis LMG 6570 = CCUG 33900]OCS42806.1 gamma-aminobutyrate permease [Campylobacter fetus subsp. venerealis cfvi02/298]ABK83097.1 lysine-specific permease [Campylobacter fetus subsp. fetus 82-40]
MDNLHEHKLKRGMNSRHLNMIAIGGAIGTGLFVASGNTIATAGPGGALLAYALIGFMVYLLMQSLGEMATYMPVAGSFEEYSARFISPSFGFAIGWNYWFNCAITVAAELVAAAIVMKFWFPDVPSTLWSALFLSVIIIINYFSSGVFGESEFWFALIKVVTVLAFIILGLAMIFGIMNGHSGGFSNWTLVSDSGESAPFVNGWFGILAVFMVAGFSFQGTELVAVAAGEAKNPEKSIPKAINAIFWRILLFYIFAIAIIGTLVPFTDPNLLRNDETDIAQSPFTMVFNRAGIAFAASVMNAVIFTAIFSAGNSWLYSSTRMLYALAHSGKAPKIFGKTNKRGVPIYALIATAIIGAACFFTSFMGDGSAYSWLINASALAGFITWMGVAWAHYKFRKAYVLQGNDPANLPFRAKWYPLGPTLALIMCAIVIIGQNFESFMQGKDMVSLLTSYVGLYLFLGIWFVHKIMTKSKPIDPLKADLSRNHAHI